MAQSRRRDIGAIFGPNPAHLPRLGESQRAAGRRVAAAEGLSPSQGYRRVAKAVGAQRGLSPSESYGHARRAGRPTLTERTAERSAGTIEAGTDRITQLRGLSANDASTVGRWLNTVEAVTEGKPGAEARLREFDGVTVRYRDPATGRFARLSLEADPDRILLLAQQGRLDFPPVVSPKAA